MFLVHLKDYITIAFKVSETLMRRTKELHSFLIIVLIK